MHPAVEKTVAALISATVLGLGGWVYAMSNRVTALEVQRTYIEQKLDNIERDVRAVRDHLLSDK